MSYSQRQQRMITLITERGNLSIVEFLLSLAVETREVEAQLWQDVVSAEPQRFQMFIPQWNQRNMWLLFGIEVDTHLVVIEYLALIRDLLAHKLVCILPDPKRHVRANAIISSLSPPAISDRDRAALEIDALLQSSSEILNLAIYTERLYALPSLGNFVANGYRSAEELALQQTYEVQLRQLRISRRLAVLSIILSGLIVLVMSIALVWHGAFTRTSLWKPGANNVTQPTSTASPEQSRLPRIVHDTVVVHDTIVPPKPASTPRRKRPPVINTDEVN